MERPLTGEPLAVDLLNTRWRDGEREVDLLDDVQGLRRWLSEAGLAHTPATRQARSAVTHTRDVLRRVVANLVTNAVDALGDGGGTVTLATGRTPDGDVCLTIADTGRGMTREQLDRAFDDFYTTKPGGTGLGLTIVRRLVTDLHGSLKVDTAPGAGTRVTVTCPRAPNGAT